MALSMWRQTGAVVMFVIAIRRVGGKNTAQGCLTRDHHLIQTLAMQHADQLTRSRNSNSRQSYSYL